MPDYKINEIGKRSLFKINTSGFFNNKSNQEALDNIVKTLNQADDPKPYFKYNRDAFGARFIELDHSAVAFLKQKNNIDSDLKKKLSTIVPNGTDCQYENAYKNNQDIQAIKEMHPDTRFFRKDGVFYCEIESEHYHCQDEKELIKLIKGDYFIIENKASITVSEDIFKNPFKAPLSNPLRPLLVLLQPFDTIYRTFRPNKSAFSNPFKPKKKKAEPVLEQHKITPIIIDGADDAANALNNTGLSQEAEALMQSIGIFPLFLRGVLLGVQGLQGEFEESLAAFKNGPGLLLLQEEMKKTQKEIAQKLGLDASKVDSGDYDESCHFIKDIAQKLKNSDDAKKLEITALIHQYETNIAEIAEENSDFTEVLTNLAGYVAMQSMFSAVLAFQIQASANLAGGSDTLDNTFVKTFTDKLTVLDFTGGTLGVVGQGLMTFFASMKAREESQEVDEIQAEINELKKCKDLNELTREIALKTLKIEKRFHNSQFAGNTILAFGQALMASGGPMTSGLLLPLLVPGVALTFTGVGINSYSSLRYNEKFAIQDGLDDIEQQILHEKPSLPKTLSSAKEGANQEKKKLDFAEILQNDFKKKICKLEILGHIRYARYHIHAKYLDQNQDQDNAITKFFKYPFSSQSSSSSKIADYITKQFYTDITASSKFHDVAMLDDHVGISVINNLHINDDDLQKISGYADELMNLPQEDYETALKEKISEFFQIKLEHIRKTQKDPISIAQQILDNGGQAAHYLKMKLIRAKVNGEIALTDGYSPYEKGPTIFKDNEPLTIASLAGNESLAEFEANSLTAFLNSARSKKDPINLSIHTINKDGHKSKKHVLARAIEIQKSEIRSKYLRPFREAGKLAVRHSDYEKELAAIKEEPDSDTLSEKKDDPVLTTQEAEELLAELEILEQEYESRIESDENSQDLTMTEKAGSPPVKDVQPTMPASFATSEDNPTISTTDQEIKRAKTSDDDSTLTPTTIKADQKTVSTKNIDNKALQETEEAKIPQETERNTANNQTPVAKEITQKPIADNGDNSSIDPTESTIDDRTISDPTQESFLVFNENEDSLDDSDVQQTQEETLTFSMEEEKPSKISSIPNIHQNSFAQPSSWNQSETETSDDDLTLTIAEEKSIEEKELQKNNPLKTKQKEPEILQERKKKNNENAATKSKYDPIVYQLDQKLQQLDKTNHETTLLQEFDQLAKEHVSAVKNVRDKQMKVQNKIIDKISVKKQKYQMISKTYDETTNITTFYYSHPSKDTDAPNAPDNLVKVERNEATKEMQVCCKKEINLMIFIRPKQRENGSITKFNNGKTSEYGSDSNKVSFIPTISPISPEANLLQARTAAEHSRG